MKELRYTLLADGPADRALMPILTWLLRQNLPSLAIQQQWADPWRFPRRSKELHEKIKTTIDFYQCDLLFVHRDAETACLEDRQAEIRQALARVRDDAVLPNAICVVPVRMTEAWLLHDLGAIRQAAGNPNGTEPLTLPNLGDIESLPNPKRILHELLRDATEKGARRRKRFDTNKAVQLIPKYIEDFSPLRRLSAFAALEEELVKNLEFQC